MSKGTILLSCVLGCAAVCCAGGCSIAGSATSAFEALDASLRRHPDPTLVREALPAYLLLLDSLVESDPEDERLLCAATLAYVRYCQAFLADERDAERAVKLYARARDYGLRALSKRAFFAEALAADMEAFRAALERFSQEDVPALHAAGAAWLGWIIADSESMAALAEMPRALAVMRRALDLDESYGAGAGHVVFGLYYAVQPQGAGQDLPLSREHFLRAIELAGSGNVFPRVLYAEYYGRATLDREFFVETLEGALAVDIARYPEHRLSNELARERALWLMAHCDELF
ncbi:MAG: TRAP transporter TatT component family protein [Planctomycetes bacterium]|nr:TRAP transporter TatT component family protein [Planctomycetota bacterium]